jgi:hypothetical protein
MWQFKSKPLDPGLAIPGAGFGMCHRGIFLISFWLGTETDMRERERERERRVVK